MDLNQGWNEQARWTRKMATGPQAKLSLRAALVIAVTFAAVGAWIWADRYEACRARGASVYECATLEMTLR